MTNYKYTCWQCRPDDDSNNWHECIYIHADDLYYIYKVEHIEYEGENSIELWKGTKQELKDLIKNPRSKFKELPRTLSNLLKFLSKDI
jgi:hypothetical protein